MELIFFKGGLKNRVLTRNKPHHLFSPFPYNIDNRYMELDDDP